MLCFTSIASGHCFANAHPDSHEEQGQVAADKLSKTAKKRLVYGHVLCHVLPNAWQVRSVLRLCEGETSPSVL